jgi:hypothetical protein
MEVVVVNKLNNSYFTTFLPQLYNVIEKTLAIKYILLKHKNNIIKKVNYFIMLKTLEFFQAVQNIR